MKKVIISIIFLHLVFVGQAQQIIGLTNWKFKTGDNLEWSKPDYNDVSWKTIQAGINWEAEGYAGYDGYAWYRIKFYLPSKMIVDDKFILYDS